jgi:hypothetical protein
MREAGPVRQEFCEEDFVDVEKEPVRTTWLSTEARAAWGFARQSLSPSQRSQLWWGSPQIANPSAGAA